MWIQNRNTQKHASAYATEFCNNAESNATAAANRFKGFILRQTFATCQALCLWALRQ